MKVKVFAVMAFVSLLLMAACDGGGGGSDSNYGPPCLVYVDDSAAGANNGSSWTDAYNNIQDGVNAASASACQVWVAEGTYASGSTDPVLRMMTGVKIYGGFAGTEESLSERTDPSSHPTYLDGQNTSYHVVIGANYALLDHFMVINGNAAGADPDNNGGGMYNLNIISLAVNNCFFYGNFANYFGGGMYNYNSVLAITNSTFYGNAAFDDGISLIGGGGMYNNSSSIIITDCTFTSNYSPSCGGGIENHEDSSSIITNCVFNSNSAQQGGGGMHNINSYPTVTNCTFHGNYAAHEGGGGMYNYDNSSPTITNCTFTLNYADVNGGGMYNYTNASPIVTNCTFHGNFVANEGGGGMSNNGNSSPTIINCIMWGDTATVSGTEIYNDLSTPTVTYSDIMGGYAGTGNINLDPMFVSGPLGDYYLDLFSPCINMGTGVPSDYGLENTTTNPFNYPDTGIVDMGYHYPIP